MSSVTAAGAAERDAAAYVAFLDAQPQVDRKRKSRRAGLLHGRRADVSHAPRRCRAHRRRGVVPRRRASSPTSPTARTG
jgi:hypothetical protein